MLPEEKLRLGLVAAASIFVYGVSLRFLVHAAVRAIRRAGARPALSPIVRRVRAIAHLLAALGVVCFAYARLVEPMWPEVTHVAVAIDKVPAGSRPIRIVHISDVHSDPDERLEARLPDLIAGEKPDLIVFTGDSINSPAGAAPFRRLMSRLATIAPTYAVRGNWDVWYWHAIDLFGGTGAVELDDRAVKVSLPGREGQPELWIAGVSAGAPREISRVLDSVPAGAVSVLLHHYPDELESAATHGADLYCAGHTHGGQVALPLYGALVTFSRFGKRYESGLHRERATWLYVNRGIGMEGGAAPRVRFFARPEITVLELKPALTTGGSSRSTSRPPAARPPRRPG